MELWSSGHGRLEDKISNSSIRWYKQNRNSSNTFKWHLSRFTRMLLYYVCAHSNDNVIIWSDDDFERQYFSTITYLNHQIFEDNERKTSKDCKLSKKKNKSDKLVFPLEFHFKRHSNVKKSLALCRVRAKQFMAQFGDYRCVFFFHCSRHLLINAPHFNVNFLYIADTTFLLHSKDIKLEIAIHCTNKSSSKDSTSCCTLKKVSNDNSLGKS